MNLKTLIGILSITFALVWVSLITKLIPSLESISTVHHRIQVPSVESKPDDTPGSILEDEASNSDTEKLVVRAGKKKDPDLLHHRQHDVTDVKQVENVESQIEIESTKQKRLRDPSKIGLKSETVTLGERQGTSETELKNTPIQLNELGVSEETEVNGSLETSKPSKGETTAGESTEVAAAELKETLKRCKWIGDLLREGKAIGDPLPQRRPGHMFWLKRPLLHTINPESQTELMILSYNLWTKKQQQEKFTNTIDILTRFHKHPLFPELLGYCPELGGEVVVAVEYVPYDSFALPRPKSIEECVNRAEKALDAFDHLDEMELVLVDMKANQWMFRETGDVVLQDVDDIVPVPAVSPYKDQLESVYRTVQRHHPSLDPVEFHQAWLRIFPERKLNIRYDVFGVQLLLQGLGFKWNKQDCPGFSREFQKCLMKIYEWTYSLTDDWPDFSQLKGALRVCFTDLEFVKPTTPHRSWNDVKEETDPGRICFRDYSGESRSVSKYNMCGHECCSSAQGIACMYTEALSKCKGE